MTSQHYVAIIGVLTSIGILMGAQPDWHHVLTPSFISATVLALASTLRAIYSDNAGKPTPPTDNVVKMPRP